MSKTSVRPSVWQCQSSTFRAIFPILALVSLFLGGVAKGDSLWVAESGGTMKLNAVDGAMFFEIPEEPYGTGAVGIDHTNGNVWTWGEQRLRAFDQAGVSFLDIESAAYPIWESPNDLLVDGVVDRLWLNLGNDLHLLDMTGQVLGSLTAYGTPCDSLTLDRQRSRLWVCSYESVKAYDSTLQLVVTIPLLAADIICRTAWDPFLDELWVTVNDKLRRYDANGQLTFETTSPAGQANNYFLKPDGSGGVWIGTKTAFIHMDSAGTLGSWFTPFPDFPMENVDDAVVNTANGSVWIAIDSHLRRFSTAGVQLHEKILTVNGNTRYLENMELFQDLNGPTAVDDVGTTNEDNAVLLNVLGNDVAQVGSLDPTSVLVTVNPQNGTATVDAVLGTVNYVPAADFFGADGFEYTVQDDQGNESAAATVTIDVLSVNDAPVATAQTLSTVEETPLPLVLSGTDVDGDALTASVVTQPANGTLSGTAPNLTYTPGIDFNGSDSFTFLVNDGTVDSVSATVSITVTATNDTPVAIAQSINTPEDTPANITLTGQDADGDTLSFAISVPPANGSISGAAPNVVYTPGTNFNGADSFSFIGNDGFVDSAPALVSISVTAVNDVPVANGQSLTTAEDTSVAVTLSGSDIDGDALNFAVSTQPANGTLSGTAPNLSYTPNTDFFGNDSFEFQANDGLVLSPPASVTITVTAAGGDAPTADSQQLQTAEITALDLVLTGSDPDADPITFEIVDAPANGALFGTAPNLTYLPGAYFEGTDSFTFRVSDGALQSPLATVIVDVIGHGNNPPRITSDAVEKLVLTPSAGLSELLDMRGWVENEDYPFLGARWGYSQDGTMVTHLSNAAPATLVGGFDFANQRIFGSLRVNTTGDDDLIGFVFGYQNTEQYYLFRWKQSFQNNLSRGMQLWRVDVPAGAPLDYLTLFDGTPGLLYSNDIPWVALTDYEYSLSFQPGLISISVTQDGALVDSIVVNDDAYTDGRFGIYNFSQVQTQYQVSEPELLTAGDYFYPVAANDPDGDAIVYRLLEAPAGMTIDAATGVIRWSKADAGIGSYPVLIEVEDPFGATDQQVYDLAVTDEAPVFVGTPATRAFAGEAYADKLTAFDPNPQDILTYSLLDAPAAMMVNPATGELQWLPGTVDLGTHPILAEVVDSQNNRGTLDYVMTVEQRPANAAPVFVSQPPLTAIVGRQYQYAPQTTDADGDTVSYSFAGSVPYDMQMFDGANITWIPTADQVTGWSITLEALDGNGGVTEQTFVIDVQALDNNQAPVITSQPGTVADIDVTYQYQVLANDADGDTLSYSLLDAPVTMSVDSASGLVTWLPGVDDIGFVDVELRVSDGRGGYADETFTLGVRDPAQNQAPSISSAPVTQGSLSVSYVYQVIATDIDGDTLSYSLLTAPAGMSIAANGRISWTPAAGQSGVNAVSVEVADGNGGTATQSYSVFVPQTGADSSNNGPTFTSVPGTSVEARLEYVYTAAASDIDGDALEFRLLQGPSGLTIDSAGVLRWVTTDNDVGDHTIRLEVVDNRGGSAFQGYQLMVFAQGGSAGNTPPQISSTPASFGRVGDAYTYPIVATDADSDPLTYTLTQGPAGMTVGAAGLLSWAPDVAGERAVRVRVSDGQGFTEQGWTLQVSEAAATIVANVNVQPLTADLGDNVTVTVAYSGSIGPVTTALTIDGNPVTLGSNGTAVVAASVLGQHTAVGTATDAFGSDSMTVNYTVVTPGPNTAPTITSVPPATAKATFEYLYPVVVDDPDGDIITYSVETGPAGMSIDSSGLLRWTPAVSGVENVVVRASDGEAFVDQGWALFISDAGIPLQATVTANPTTADLNSSVALSIGYSGASGTVSLSMTVDGVVVPVDANGMASVSADTVGLHTATAIVTDAYGSDTASTIYTVIDPNAVSSPPVVSLTSPDFEEEITAPRDAIGSVTDPDDDLLSWSLLLQASGAEPTEFTTLASGTTAVPNGVLGQIDPTMLLNGLYNVILQATDAAGNVSQDSRVIRVTGDMKIGNFSITFEDFSAPVAGLPVTVLRTYDTRRRSENLDFGFGWTVDYQNVRLQESRDIGFSWTLIEEDLGLFSQWCVRPNGDPTVTVRMPDGEIESFVARAEPECTQIVPTVDVQIVFDPVDGTDSTLEQTGFGVVRIVGNNIVDLGSPGVPIDPDGYRLTTPEGLVFTLDQAFGIQQVEEPNGSTLTFSASGVVHSQGFALAFTRDGQGRITDITAPDGTSMSYGYDVNGDLTSFTDQVNQVTTYTYRAGAELHYLEDIVDPRGIRVSRNEYDTEGRLTAIIDADGNRIEYDHNVIGRTETVRDRRGNPTVYVYDDEGNVLVETNALGESITRTYDADRNELSMSNDLGYATIWTYDERGNQLSETNALLQTTTSSYDSRNLLLTVTDELGNPVMSNVYHPNNTNLLTMTDALGNTTSFHWDTGIGGGCSTGASLGSTDALLNRTVIQPQCAGPFGELPLFQEDARNVRTSFGYDTLGRAISETTTRTDENGVVQTLVTGMEYDDKGRLFRVTDPEGNVTVTEYNAIDKESATIDANLERTEYEYDARGNLVLTRYPDLTTETTAYDEEGNVTSQTDRLGRTTTMSYNAANRLVETVFPDATPGNDLDNPRTTNEYDTAGRLTATIDERGNRTEFEYDDAGRRTLVRDTLLQETRFEYDARGLRTAMVDALNRRTEFVYDNAGRLLETIFPDNTPGDQADNLRSATGYDALGRKTSETDLAGLTTSFEYDELGNLTVVIDALNQRTEYGYDEQSNKITQTDAELRTTSWAYDDLGRVVSRTLPAGQSESFVYDDNGNRTSHTDFNGALQTFGYDALNRQTTASYADGVTVTTAYTDTGQVASITDDRGATSFTYDERDRLTGISYPGGRTIGYGYDAAGNRSSLTTANQSLSYGFDVLNRLSTVTDEAGTTTYTYNAVGSRSRVVYANNAWSQYVYDPLNRLLRIDHFNRASQQLDQHNYTLGPNGNRLRHWEFGNGARAVDYVYDDLYRLTSETVSDATLGDRTATWTYDAVGNRLSEVETTTAGTDTTTYSYDANDRLLTETVTGLNPDTLIYSYDNNGNTLTRIDGSGTTSYAYDSRNRLSNLNSGQTTYLYDASGIRMSETSSGLTTNYLVDPNRDYAQVVEESFDLNGFAEVRYTYGDDLIAQHRRVDALTTNSSTYHYDGIGSTRRLTDTNSLVTDSYAYTAFGELAGGTGFTQNDYLYTGEQFDPNLGFYYLRARYYNAGIGRLQNMDPFAGFESDPKSLHKYAYVYANPVVNLDPSGRVTLQELRVGIALYANQAVIAASPFLYLTNHVVTKLGSSQVAQFIQLSANRFTGGVSRAVNMNPQVLRLHAGRVFEKILDPAMRLIRAVPQSPIFNGAARPDWILRGKHIVDAKLGQHINLKQLELFVRFASEKGGSITYVTLTRVPPNIRSEVLATAKDVTVSFISLTPF